MGTGVYVVCCRFLSLWWWWCVRYEACGFRSTAYHQYTKRCDFPAVMCSARTTINPHVCSRETCLQGNGRTNERTNESTSNQVARHHPPPTRSRSFRRTAVCIGRRCGRGRGRGHELQKSHKYAKLHVTCIHGRNDIGREVGRAVGRQEGASSTHPSQHQHQHQDTPYPWPRSPRTANTNTSTFISAT